MKYWPLAEIRKFKGKLLTNINSKQIKLESLLVDNSLITYWRKTLLTYGIIFFLGLVSGMTLHYLRMLNGMNQYQQTYNKAVDHIEKETKVERMQFKYLREFGYDFLTPLQGLIGHIEILLTKDLGTEKELVEQMKGTSLELKKKLVQTLHLNQNFAPEEKKTYKPNQAKNVQILLAEDNLVNQRVVRTILTSVGFPVDVAVTGAEAVEKANQKKYQLIFMDYEMPGGNGAEATKSIKRGSGPSQEATIIALTAHSRRRDRERCLNAGMDDYLSKPATSEEIMAMIYKWVPLAIEEKPSVVQEIPKKKAQEESFAKESEVKKTSSTEKKLVENNVTKMPSQKKKLEVLDDDFMKKSPLREFMADKTVFTEIINIFLKQFDETLDVMRTAIEGSDHRQLEKSAHLIVGSLRQIGLTDSTQIASRLEEMGKEHQVEGALELFHELQTEVKRLYPQLEALAA